MALCASGRVGSRNREDGSYSKQKAKRVKLSNVLLHQRDFSVWSESACKPAIRAGARAEAQVQEENLRRRAEKPEKPPKS